MKMKSILVLCILLLTSLTGVAAADEQKIHIMYVAWTPSPALELASEMSEHADDIKFTYIPSYNTTTWAGPSDELIEAANNGLLDAQDVIFFDMLTSDVYEPLNDSLMSAKDNGSSFVDIRSMGTPQ